jgi:hypothetical protein
MHTTTVLALICLVATLQAVEVPDHPVQGCTHRVCVCVFVCVLPERHITHHLSCGSGTEDGVRPGAQDEADLDHRRHRGHRMGETIAIDGDLCRGHLVGSLLHCVLLHEVRWRQTTFPTAPGSLAWCKHPYQHRRKHVTLAS